ncbi:MAG: xanthine dehydrogenase family protein molybdopterin-binding subunit [Gammaproteobacteria bacterium]|nr:xanthine dehydrogenase family protein molybdopterin-binding subunit [Gammaproteobacteria bacterium]
MSGTVFKLKRRDFVKFGLAAGGSLTLGIGFGNEVAAPNDARVATAGDLVFAPNAFIRIDSNSTVTVISKHTELGQGIFTGLTTVVADELDADWSQIRVEGAPADAARYNNLNWGPYQGTGGSSSMSNAYLQMRRAGATARAMLIGAAATEWNVPREEITIRRGQITHAASRRHVAFGEFAARAAAQPVPKNAPLKDATDFVYIGHDVARLDKPQKTDGSAVYTQDIRLPDMLTALVQHAPRFGATVKSFDASAAKRIDGVTTVVAIESGVAVVADNFWAAKKGRDALRVEWDETGAFRGGSEEILAQYRALARQPGKIARNDGNVNAAFDAADKIVEAAYEFPYLSHATMEPMNCVARVTDRGCELWYGAQSQTGDQNHVAAALGLDIANVTINMLYAGGSFGRRADRNSDYVVEAARIARAAGGDHPVKLVWTREDDMRAGGYRPLNYHFIRGALDRQGRITAWQQRIVGQSILAGSDFADVPNALDHTTVEGASTLSYLVPNVEVEVHNPVINVPVLWWRSVGHSHTAFSIESFLDELAHAAGKDPLAVRLALLAHDQRQQNVVRLAAREAGWDKPLPKGRGRGIAVHEAYKTCVAEVVEVSAHSDGSFSVDKVTIAVDCGIAVNPDIVVAQMQGGMGYGLSAALGDEITIRDGIVQQDNFDTYPVLRMSQMPEVAVHIVASNADPTGVGEPGLPPIAPAVANALFAATGKRHRRLPLKQASEG